MLNLRSEFFYHILRIRLWISRFRNRFHLGYYFQHIALSPGRQKRNGQIAYCFMRACICKARWHGMKDRVSSGRMEFWQQSLYRNFLRKMEEEVSDSIISFSDKISRGGDPLFYALWKSTTCKFEWTITPGNVLNTGTSTSSSRMK